MIKKQTKTQNLTKKISLGLAAFALMFSAVAFKAQAVAPAWDTSGSYVVGFQLTGSSDVYSHDMTLVQNSSGSITSGNGGYPAGGPHTFAWTVSSGVVTGNVINLTSAYTLGAIGTTTHMTGTISPDGSMSGTWDDNYGGGSRTGTWSTTSGSAKYNTVVVVSGDTSAGYNMPGWLFNRDLANATPIAFQAGSASIGSGSLYVQPISSTDAPRKFIAENFINAPIADVDSISYDFKIGAGGLATQEEQFYMNVYANFGVSDNLEYYDCKYDVVPTVGSVAGYTTVTFDPTMAYPVTTRGGATPSPFACPAIPADMNLQSARSNIRAFALNLGDTSLSDANLDGYFDNVVVKMASSITTFDFDPTPVNVAPVLANIATPVTIAPLIPYTFTATATDANMSDTLTFSLAGAGIPAGAVMTSAGVFTWTPTALQASQSYTFDVVVSDGVLTDSQTITIMVSAVVVPPTTPTTKDQCKNGGWMNFGTMFKNQGQCVSYTNHN
ncbi:MAG: hypothetical protein M3Q34_04000 [bacterium]|nr:hypothetical protein [bacterium]